MALVRKRSYFTSEADGREWRQQYLANQVRTIQGMKQNHVRVKNAQGVRVPLAHCRRADNKNKCKGEFPRTL